jgi:hypothetical protein
MYARAGITTTLKKDSLVVPVDAIADLGGRRGVFQHLNGVAVFRTVELGTEGEQLVEVVGGLTEGDQVITTGARALRDGDRIQLAGGEGGRRGNGGRGRGDGATAPAARDGGASPNATPGATGGRQGNETSGQRFGSDGSGRRSGGDGTGRRSGGDGSGRYGDGSGRRSGGDGTQRPPSGQRPGNGGSSQ